MLPASGIKVSESGNEATITFPSLAAYRLTDKDQLPAGETVTLSLQDQKRPSRPPLLSNVCLYLPQAKPPKASFTMTSRARFVAATGGRGRSIS